MPDGIPTDLPRILFDESSLELLPTDLDEVNRSLTGLGDTLEALLLAQGKDVHVSDLLYDQPCLGEDLTAILFTLGRLDRDVCRRLSRLLDRCRSWSVFGAAVGGQVIVAGRPVAVGSSLTLAVELAGRAHNAACLGVDAAGHSGFQPVVVDGRTQQVFFFASAEQLTSFWRELFERENVVEANFFVLAREAFDALVFCETLSFRRFAGSYSELRGPVVGILSGLNDHFAAVHERCRGVRHEVQAVLRGVGVNVSPESPGTHGSERLMAHRWVQHKGREYRCEWHAKVERHRNRVHFALPDERLGGRILVGLFVDHLPT